MSGRWRGTRRPRVELREQRDRTGRRVQGGSRDALTRCLRDFVTGNFAIPNDIRLELDDTTSFLDHGILDSSGVLEIVAFVEERFGIAIADEELVPANFESLAALASFIERKQHR